MARGEKLRTALTASVCASGEESSKDSLVRRFGVSKDSFAYSEFYLLCEFYFCARWSATSTRYMYSYSSTSI